MQIKYCKKCHHKKRTENFEKVLEEFKKINPKAEIITDCNSTCGPGRKKFIIHIDDETYFEDNLVDVFERLREENEN